MYDPEFLSLLGTCKDKNQLAGPWSERPVKDDQSKGDSLEVASSRSDEIQNNEVGGKEEIWAHEACVPSLPGNHPNPSPTNLPARKKHDAVPTQLLNANSLVQILGMKP